MHTYVKTWLGIAIIIIVAVTAGVFIWVCNKNYVINYVTDLGINSNKKQESCPAIAKVCPDGTAVGPTGPNCEFAPCPEENNIPDLTPNEVEEWQTYQNGNCDFELKYPADWILKESDDAYSDITILVYSPEIDQEIKEILKKGIATEGPAPDVSVVCYENYKDQPNIKQNVYSITEYVNDDINFTKPEKINFAGKSAWQARSAGLYYIYVIIVPVGNSLIEISVGYPLDNTIKSINDLPEVYDQILSTFKFID